MLQELQRRTDKVSCVNLLGRELKDELPDPVFLPTKRLTPKRKRELKQEEGFGWDFKPDIRP